MTILNTVDVDTWIDGHPTTYRISPQLAQRLAPLIQDLHPTPVAGPLRARVRYRYLHMTGPYVAARSDLPLALVQVIDVNGKVLRTAVGPSIHPAANINYAHELIREMTGTA